MTPDSDASVRRVLDAMESTHRRVTAFGWLTVVATLAAYTWLDHVARTSADLKRVIMAAVLALTCVIAWTTFALAVAMLRMGRRILRAITLTATGSESAR
jgi:hypothetical protein